MKFDVHLEQSNLDNRLLIIPKIRVQSRGHMLVILYIFVYKVRSPSFYSSWHSGLAKASVFCGYVWTFSSYRKFYYKLHIMCVKYYIIKNYFLKSQKGSDKNWHNARAGKTLTMPNTSFRQDYWVRYFAIKIKYELWYPIIYTLN